MALEGFWPADGEVRVSGCFVATVTCGDKDLVEVLVERGSLSTRCCAYVGPKVRIRLPPAASLLRTRPPSAKTAHYVHPVPSTPAIPADICRCARRVRGTARRQAPSKTRNPSVRRTLQQRPRQTTRCDLRVTVLSRGVNREGIEVMSFERTMLVHRRGHSPEEAANH